MSGRIGSSGDLDQNRVQPRSLQEKKDQDSFKAAIEVAPPIIKESFITSVMAARQPPRMSLDETASQMPDASAALFSKEITALTRMTDVDISGDLANVYLTHIKDAQNDGGPQLTEAFDYLGEVLMNYEHLRMLRTGELG